MLDNIECNFFQMEPVFGRKYKKMFTEQNWLLNKTKEQN